MHNKKSLIDVLLILTNNLITQINSHSLYEKGLLNKPQKISLELILNERKLKLKQGYVNNSQSEEKRYRKILKEWFKDEKAFINEITPLLESVQPQLIQFKERTTLIINSLNEYRFSDFVNKSVYDVNNVNLLIHKHSGNELMPYTIALLSEIKFLDYFFDEFTKNKTDGFKKLGNVFNTNERRIKGNINILNSVSNEDPTQYTSINYTEIIQKELKGL